MANLILAIGGTSGLQLLPLQGPTGPLVVLLAGDGIFAYNATNGALVWDVALPASTVVDGVAVVAGGLVVQISGYNYVLHR